MISLLQNMRSLIICWQIFVPNHVWFQLSEVLLNVRVTSTSTHPVITNIINSWSYTTLLWLNNIMAGIFVISHYWVHDHHIQFYEYYWLACSWDVIDNKFLYPFHYITIFTPYKIIMLLGVIKYTIAITPDYI